MFYLDNLGLYHCQPWDRIEWLVHGFGTRDSCPPDHVATAHQVHSDIVLVADGRGGRVGTGDALVTDTPGAAVGVRTADCLPILLVDTRQHAVAAVHAGWRGTVQGVTRRTVAAMAERFDSRPEDLEAAIGPGIGGCCFEVGPEVAAEFGRSGRVKIDLAAANREQLEKSGISPVRIYCAGLCTVCAGGNFCSYRREKEQAGRMLSFVGIR